MTALRALFRTGISLCTAGVLGLLCPAPGIGERPAGAVGTPLLEGGVHDSGVGTYTDASVANQVSNFTVNPQMVSCGVGTIAPGPHSAGPFAMLMYATKISSYVVDREARTITVQGRMRSITRMGTMTVEDVEHDFLAVALDQPDGHDRFDVHFVTPFWNPDNPMATHSTLHDGWVRFGGEVIMDAAAHQLGDIVVDR
jgi:hypothetical protein